MTMDEQLLMYQDFDNKYTCNAQKSGWGSKYSQELRFKIITKVIMGDIVSVFGDDIGYNILDIGSGRDDLEIFINNEKSNIKSIITSYIGIDYLKGIEYESYQVHKYIDISVSSGGLSFTNPNSIYDVINKMVKTSRLGVVFNLLDYNNEKNKVNDGEYFYDKGEVVGNLIKYYGDEYHIKYYDEYLPNEDFTISIVKKLSTLRVLK